MKFKQNMFHCSYKTTSSTKPQSQCYTFGQTLKFKDIFRFSRECTNSPYKRWQYSRKKKKIRELSQKPLWHSTKTHSAGWALMQSTTGISLPSQPTTILLCTYLQKNAQNGIPEQLPFKYILWAACPRTPGRSPQIVNNLLPAVSLLLPDLLRTLWRYINLVLLWNRIAARLKALNWYLIITSLWISSHGSREIFEQYCKHKLRLKVFLYPCQLSAWWCEKGEVIC